MEFRVEGQALVEVCSALEPPGVDGSFDRVDDGGVADFGKLVGEEFSACHARAVGEVEFDLVPVAVDDLVQLVQRDDDLGAHGRLRAGGLVEEDVVGGFE